MEGICNNNQKVPNLVAASRAPVDGTFELTVRCNLHCKMCLFRHKDIENKKILEEELRTEEWIDLAKQAAEAGTFSLLLTGGEPMLRSDFCEIYEGIYRLGFYITLYTNATLVTPRIMSVFQKYPPHRIGITIYGASSKTYHKVCGDANAFECMLEGVKQLQTLPSVIDFRTTVIKDNFHDVDAMEAMLSNQFHSDSKLIQSRIVNKPVRGGCADVDTCRLSPEDNVKLFFRREMNYLREVIGEDFLEENVRFQKLEKTFEQQDFEEQNSPKMTLFGCSAGMTSYTISWDGKLLGCQMLGNFSSDVRSHPLKDAWEEYPSLVKIPSVDEACQSCKEKEFCNSCYASRYAETGNLGGKPEYVCRDAAIIYNLLNHMKEEENYEKYSL